MQCPVCDTQLTMSERQGIEIDFCPRCRGVWLDRGELDKIIERSSPISARPAHSSGNTDPGGYARDSGHGHRRRKKSFLEELFD